jgi:microcystin-dependent protein
MARNYSSVVEPKTLTANVGTSDTQITLNNVTGLPSAPYVLVLNPDTNKEEAVLVTVDQTGVTSPTLKVQRAIEATGGVGVATTHSIGHIVKHMIVGSDLQIVHDHFSNESTTAGTAHGATGGVVGRTNSQTLTNKTIDLTDNTLRGTKAEFNASLEDADFVTVTGTETLTNKTLTSPVITGGTVNGGAALTVDSTELNTLDGITSSAAELNILDGATLTTTELNYVDGVTSAIQTQLNANTPVGVINMWIGTSAPATGGWLLCQGQQLAIAGTYNALYQVIGTNYGNLTNGSGGTGSTHFRLPDLRGRIPMGIGTGRNVADNADLTARAFDPATFSKISDAETVTLTALQSGLRAHGHPGSTVSITDPAHRHAQSGREVGTTAGGAPALIDPSFNSGGTFTGYAQTGITASPTIAEATAVAAQDAHNNVQPSTLINFIIKF